jgi:UDP-N-acetylmuramate dehydrogenase
MGFRERFSAILQEQAPLAPLTHLRIGGCAEYLATPRNRGEMAELVVACRSEGLAFRILGEGTNLLVRDEGVSGVVVRMTSPEFASIDVRGKTVKAGGGATLSSLISSVSQAGLAGFETLVGITATVGGALRCNAGDRAGEIADNLTSIEVIDETGAVRRRDRSEVHFGENVSDITDPVILTVEFALEPDNPDSIVKRMRRSWINRKAAQPLNHQAAVRAFKDPKGRSAAQLIERASLKRTKVGAVEVSDRNANYIIAHPGSTAGDVLKLAELMRDKVEEVTGIALEQEFKVW